MLKENAYGRLICNSHQKEGEKEAQPHKAGSPHTSVSHRPPYPPGSPTAQSQRALRERATRMAKVEPLRKFSPLTQPLSTY